MGLIVEGIGAVMGLFGGMGAGGEAEEAAANVGEDGIAGGVEIGQEAAGADSSEGASLVQGGDSEPEGGWDSSEDHNNGEYVNRNLAELLPEMDFASFDDDDVPPPPSPPGMGEPAPFVEWAGDEFADDDDEIGRASCR